MASKQLQDLKLSEEQAEQIIELGISLGAVEADDMPETKKDKIQAAAARSWRTRSTPGSRTRSAPATTRRTWPRPARRSRRSSPSAGVSVDEDNEVTVGEPAR